jgi:pimeloyl-ACP methyl ester carboxylesterase
MMTSLRRGDKWSSRAVAEKQISKSPFFAAFDPRVMKKYLKYTLSDQEGGSVKLATPKAQEAWSYVRATFESLPEEPTTVEDRQRERLLNPELVPGTKASKMVFTRPEGVPLLEMLPHVRPRVLYVYGGRSHINYDKMRDLHLSRTGTGASGNGGVADGGVESVIINKCSHLVCFENTTEVAKSAGAWMQKEMTRWRKEKEFFVTYDRGTSKNGRTELSDKWLAGVKQDANIQRSGAKTAKL